MTSLQAADTPWDIKISYDVSDLRKPSTGIPVKPGTLMGIIENNKDFSKFAYMVKLGQLEDRLNAAVANSTIFIPSDAYIDKHISEDFFINMDLYTAKEVVLYHTLNKRVSYDMLNSSYSMYLDTMVDKEMKATILCENHQNEPVLNNHAKIIIPDIKLTNGLIHIINDLLIPPEFTNTIRRYITC